jgi:ERCC4-type nuclease
MTTDTESEAEHEEGQQTSTFMTKSGVQARMKADSRSASRIKDAFVTVEQMLDAVEADKPLEQNDGIGPKSADTIRDWYENRQQRERSVSLTTVQRTGSKTLSIKNNGDWSGALHMQTGVDDE